jgi:hypothetical protein
MHVELANEVVQLAQSNRLLKPTADLRAKFPVRVPTFAEAVALAHLPDDGQTQNGFRPLRPEFKLRERELRERLYSLKNWKELRARESESFKLIDAGVSAAVGVDSEIFDDVLANLAGCYVSRLVDGKIPFFDSIFEVYQNGAWPCGLDATKRVVVSY